MEIKSDIECKGTTWHKVGHGYGFNEDPNFFDTFWGVFKTCMAIGILYNKQIEDDDMDDENDKMTIPRTMFNRNSSEMDMFFQSAILTSTCVDLDEKDRLYLAFIEGISADELLDEEREELKKGVSQEALTFDKVKFLKGFANYGATKLLECLDNNDGMTMENLANFLNDSYNGETEELLKLKEVDELIDDDIS